MKQPFWENEDPANGDVIAVIDMEDGAGVQKFKGTTVKEVADKLLVAQLNASDKIRRQERELRTHVKPDVEGYAPVEAKPRSLTADERLSVTTQLDNAAQAPEAIVKVVEAATGVPLSEIGKKVSQGDVDKKVADAKKEAADFCAEHPEFYQCAHNSAVMQNYLRLHRWLPTKKNLTLAFEGLAEQGLLRQAPDEPESTDGGEEPPTDPRATRIEEPTGNPTSREPETRIATRPRGVVASSGIRSSDTSLNGRPQRSTQPKYTIAQIESMPIKEYDWKMANESGFEKLVNDLYESARKPFGAR